MSGITNQFVVKGGKGENLFPSFHQLTTRMDENYQTAITYYQQRERIFEQVLAREGVSSAKAYQEMINKKVRDFQTKIIDVARARVIKQLEAGSTMKEVIAQAKSAKSTNDYEVAINDVITQGWGYRNGRTNQIVVGFREGFPFERWLEEHATSVDQEKKVNQFSQNIMRQLVGSVRNMAATVAKAGDIRSDIAIAANGQTIAKDTQFELKTIFNIEDFKNLENPGLELLNAILNSGDGVAGLTEDGYIFGFQVKAYDKSDSGRWQNSVPLARALQECFDSSNPNTWSSEYSTLYPYYFLSKYVLNIVNPVNIGTITKEGLEYNSEFLNHYRFYMEVTYDARLRQNRAPDDAPLDRGGGIEIHPKVVGTTVLLRQVKDGKKLTMLAERIKSRQRDISTKVLHAEYI